MAIVDLTQDMTARQYSRPLEIGVVRQTQSYFFLLSLLAVAAFVLGVENRFSVSGLFFLSPPVDLIPPLSTTRWVDAFIIHQQDPIFSSCGGSESLEEFQTLYWWEWLRRASLAAVAGMSALGLACAGLLPRFRFVLPRLAMLLSLTIAFALAHAATVFAAERIDAVARYNVGQYRHAVDAAMLSAIVAAIVASVFLPPQPFALRARRRIGASGWLWIGAVLLDIVFGAIFASRGAASFWSTWPGYQGRAFPDYDQLTSYSPAWLNLTFNPYAIQAVHRSLSFVLWIGALAFVIAALRRNRARNGALFLFVLVNLEMAAGVATLTLDLPPVLSILHQLGGIFLLAASFVVFAQVEVVPRMTISEKSR